MTDGGDDEWRVRPCLREWTAHRHPCGFYRWGRDCDRSWAELVPRRAFDVVTALCLANTLVCGGFVVRGVVRSRAARRERRDQRRNALEEVLYVHLASLACQAVAFSDINGFARRFPPAVGDGAICAAHLCCELVIFKYCVAYRDAIDGMVRRFKGRKLAAEGFSSSLRRAGETCAARAAAAFRRRRFEVFATVAVGLNVSLCATEHHPQNREGCVRSRLNLAKHAGRGLLEVSFMLECLRHGFSVRRRLLGAGDAAARSERTRAAIRAVIARLTCLSVVIVLESVWFCVTAFAIVKLEAASCHQPACTVDAFVFGEAAWIAVYVLVDWCVVVAFAPPPVPPRVRECLVEYSCFFAGRPPPPRPAAPPSDGHRPTITIGSKRFREPARAPESPRPPRSSSAATEQDTRRSVEAVLTHGASFLADDVVGGLELPGNSPRLGHGESGDGSSYADDSSFAPETPDAPGAFDDADAGACDAGSSCGCLSDLGSDDIAALVVADESPRSARRRSRLADALPW